MRGVARFGFGFAQLAKLATELGALAAAVGSQPATQPREQERLEVDQASRAKPKPKRAAARKKA